MGHPFVGGHIVVEPSLVNTVFFPQKYMNDPISRPIVPCYLLSKHLLLLFRGQKAPVGGAQVDLCADQSGTRCS